MALYIPLQSSIRHPTDGSRLALPVFLWRKSFATAGLNSPRLHHHFLERITHADRRTVSAHLWLILKHFRRRRGTRQEAGIRALYAHTKHRLCGRL